MRFLCRSIFITIFFIVPYASYALLEELHKLNKNLLTLSSFLSKELTSSTYEQLQEIIGAAYSKKNPLLLDKYEQTIAIKTARYLLQELLQEGGKPENRPEYIPFMSLLAEEISKNYPNKQDVFTCVSLASGDLENEFLLVRMLRFLGYTTVHLVAIDPKYYHRADEIKHNFLSWSNERKITISLEETQIKNGVILQLFSDYFDYINKVAAGLLPRNKLFLMIQASNTLDLINGNLWPPFMPQISSVDNINKLTFAKYPASKGTLENKFTVYLPYDSQAIFYDQEINTLQDYQKNIALIKNFIKEYVQTQLRPYYQSRLITFLGKKFPNLLPKIYWNVFVLENDSTISFLDLIKHTSIASAPLLAYEVGGLRIRAHLTDLSGSIEDIFKRYF